MTERIYSNVTRRGLLTHRPILTSGLPSPLIDRIVLFRTQWSALRIAVHTFWGGLESTKKTTLACGHHRRSFIEITPDAPYIDEVLLQITMDELELSLKTAARMKLRGMLSGFGRTCAAVEIRSSRSERGKVGDMSRQQKQSVHVVGTTGKIATMTKETTVMSTWREKWEITKPCCDCWIVEGVARELMGLRWFYYGAPREHLKHAICRYFPCQPVSMVSHQQ
ncbi:hypothetical protein EDD17DRAFT_1211765 [Pisolithus thermaeus]|nr:hypothetical protein EDD17DRAFT_1211765 [Pisolithus thermaeus]